MITFVCFFFVCLSVCRHDDVKTSRTIPMKLGGAVEDESWRRPVECRAGPGSLLEIRLLLITIPINSS